jgi:hypothetical protein
MRCAGRRSLGANDPQDCDWPMCRCDEHANKVIEALVEAGWQSPGYCRHGTPKGFPCVRCLAMSIREDRKRL